MPPRVGSLWGRFLFHFSVNSCASAQVGSAILLVALQALTGANHVIQDGFVTSGAVLCWCAVAPPLAGILLQSRIALFATLVTTMAIFIGCNIATEYWEEALYAALAGQELMGVQQVVFFVIDVSMPALVLVLAVFYYDLRLSSETKRSENLLNRIMPRKFASKLRAGVCRENVVEQYDNATCLFAEVVEFAELVETHPASDVIATIDTLFEQMDGVASQVGVLKVATIGNVYLAVAGVPIVSDARESARKMANFALALRDLMSRNTEKYGIRIRIGMHSGPVVAGVIGSLSPQFTLIGDSVNVASRMESTSAAGRIHCSEATWRLLESDFTLSKRSPISIKGKGMMQTFWLVNKKKLSDSNDVRRSRGGSRKLRHSSASSAAGKEKLKSSSKKRPTMNGCTVGN
jgi:class 3 adenylate cyclase